MNQKVDKIQPIKDLQIKKNEDIQLEKIKIKIAHFFRIKREQKKMTLRDLAKISKVSYMVIFRIENGSYKNQKGNYKMVNPNLNSLYKILNALNSDFFELFKFIEK